jgi:uncharacterized membrane protein
MLPVTSAATVRHLGTGRRDPAGYGHLYNSSEYLSGWIGISEPDGWTEADTTALEEVLAERERSIEE